MTPETEKQVSIHEAGHAIAALLLGKQWGCSLLSRGGLSGVGTLDETAFESVIAAVQSPALYVGVHERDVLVDAILTAAGYVAERLDAHDAFLCGFKRGCDRENLHAACEKLLNGVSDDSCQSAFIEFVARSARRLLGPHLRSIRAVADELQHKRKLTADEVARIHAGIISCSELA